MEFFKYQGTGNDFIMIDGIRQSVNFSVEEISAMCDRRFGIGADGVIIIKENAQCDFEMDYYNADGSQSFCGNGSRCAQAFAKSLNLINGKSEFLAIDGVHEGKIKGDMYATKMGDVNKIEIIHEDYFIHTGSPHYIRYVKDVDKIDVVAEGLRIRNSDAYKEEGTNVNFVSVEGDLLKVRTYERGVEDETFSCGTGVTAVAISYVFKNNLNVTSVPIMTKGGALSIELNRSSEKRFNNIWLIGPAKKVYKGNI